MNFGVSGGVFDWRVLRAGYCGWLMCIAKL